ncbi:MAG: toxin TcdB middle/N-terminal domain-containing protein, partial [Anaerolineae bacterium]
EGLFARIIRVLGGDDDYWQVRSKDGLVSLYGTPGAKGSDPAAVADPTDRNKVYAWKLSETRDPFGNRIAYEYQRDPGPEGPRQWNQLYLQRIRYVDYGDGSGAPRFLVSVTFDYEERPDPFSDHRAGFEVRTRRRCRRIQVRTHPDDETHLVRTIEFDYAQDPNNGASLLTQVQVTGHDGDDSERLPSLTFGYTRFDPGSRDFFPVQGRDLPAHSLASPDLELADLFGNGLPDILEMNGVVRYWRNLGGGRFDLPRSMKDAPAGLALANPDVQLLDADGDGRVDLMVTQNGLAGAFPLQHNGEWDRRSFRRFRQAPSFSLADPEVKLVDMDGDGVTDAIRSGSRLECYFNDASEGWSRTRFVPRQTLDVFPNVSFADPRVHWADLSGDGLQDIALIHDGNVAYWPSLGHGDWGPQVTMQNSPRLPRGYDPRRILVGDVDGDGLADIVYVDHQRVVVWINQSGNGWSEPIEYGGTPPVSDMDDVRLVDLLGSGIAGLLWTTEARGNGRPSMHFLDFAGGVKPYLLNEMDNHMGALTRIAYAPSTHFYQEDAVRPETRWPTPLPFPVQVVARVEVIDHLSGGKLATEYRYHHGYWDGAEREYRGFGMVEQLDSEVFEVYGGPGLHHDRGFTPVEAEHFSPPTRTPRRTRVRGASPRAG